MRFLKRLILLLLLVLAAASFFFWDGTSPQMSWVPPDALGSATRVPIEFVDDGRGLRRIEVRLRQGETQHLLYEETFPTVWLPWRSGTSRQAWALEGNRLKELGFRQGSLELMAMAEDQPNFGLFSRRLEVIQELNYDTTPPRVSPLSRQHYIRQGGSEAILYRVSEPAISGVMVGEQRFAGYPVAGHPEGTHIALFALGWDGATDSRIRLWAEDTAGNRSTSTFWYRIQLGRYRQRTINITDNFIEQVAPQILSNTPELAVADFSLEELFVAINSQLRVSNNNRIAELTVNSADRILWDSPFQQLSNSQVESHFADQRSYRYDGRVIDRQTHLGFDLASTAQSPIEASNAGQVTYADYLGIYGNCLLIDHGLGLYSLYGHLSSFEVAAGDMVTRGQVVGRSGQTGLAAGDHLHFSMVLRGVQVNPVEWWDPKWVENHLLSKLMPAP